MNTISMSENEQSPFGYNLAKLLVLTKIKKELGLDRVEHAYFGAAPMSGHVKKFFIALGMPLINMYGLSETSGAATYMEPPFIQSLDKAGIALPGTQIKIFNPDESGVGEICIRGRNIFMGYLNGPQETFDVMDSEGYFHTGDIGCVDQEGFLEITGRLKEIIITAGGENVSPIPIEIALKEACPILSHVLVIGDERKYLTCLLTVKCRMDHQTRGDRPTNELAPEVISFISGLGLRGKTTLKEIQSDPSVLTYIQKCVESVNSRA